MTFHHLFHAPSVGAMLLLADDAPSQSPKINSGDTAWMLISTALVLLMTIPALALFYGGLVRSKNVLSTLMHSFFCAAAVTVAWVILGYTLAFGPTKGGWIGGLDFLDLAGTLHGTHPNAPTIPHALFVMYQLTFAIITPALISGAFAERMRFKAFALYSVLWSLIIYAPLAHWVWGGGWIQTNLKALDFAGGTVVHISSGISALVCALFLGKRTGLGVEPMTPHNLPFTLIGASMLWVGWFGFNAGSAGSSGNLAALAMLNTHCAAAAAALCWVLTEAIKGQRATLLGIASGAVAGLVAVTPAAGYVGPIESLLIGALAGGICCLAVSLKSKFGYDDALDVVGVHFVGGTLGALLTGLLASTAYNPDAVVLPIGQMFMSQVGAVAATIAFAGLGSWVLLFIVNKITPVRATREEEILGMDLSQHSERAYALPGGEAVSMGHLDAPRSADRPPPRIERFTVVLDGLDQQRLLERWRSLCQERPEAAAGVPSSSPSPAFAAVYANVTTLRDNRFRFRAGDRQETAAALQSLFADLSPGVKARVETDFAAK